jgi:hypothetical protein
MSKSDEYRANADECQKMARRATHPGEKATWLQMAQDWLRMIKQPEQSASDKFDAAEKAQGTGQDKSTSGH